MAGLRLFVAIELPDDVKAALTGLKTDIPGAAWVRPNAMHLTLKFLGDGIDERRVPELIGALGSVRGAPFALAVRGVGRFPPGERKPARVLWAGLDAPRALPALAGDIERAVEPLGFPPEGRPFSPHLTLARLKTADAGPALGRFLARHAGLRAEPFPVDSVHLFASQLGPQGPAYSRLARFPLTPD